MEENTYFQQKLINILNLLKIFIFLSYLIIVIFNIFK